LEGIEFLESVANDAEAVFGEVNEVLDLLDEFVDAAVVGWGKTARDALDFILLRLWKWG
jgi:hypothetical protein